MERKVLQYPSATNKRLILKGFLLSAFAACFVLTSFKVHAFGGSSSQGYHEPRHMLGANIFGIYWGSDEKVEIDFTSECPENASRNQFGICNCNDGFFPSNNLCCEKLVPSVDGCYEIIQNPQACDIKSLKQQGTVCKTTENYAGQCLNGACAACPDDNEWVADVSFGCAYNCLGTAWKNASGVCTECPDNATCDNTTYTCDAGAGWDATEDTCPLCESGTFKENAGNYACTACADGSYQAEKGQTECTPVPNGFGSKDKKSIYQCNANEASPVGAATCTTCSGNAVPNGAKSACEACSGNTVPNKLGEAGYSLANTVCVACGTGSEPNKTGQEAQEANTLCVCSKGYGFKSNACVACASGTEYKADSGNSLCKPCPQNATCASTTDFTCNAGYKKNATAGTCELCAKGDTDCNCPEGQVPTGNGSCGCPAGQELKEGVCTACGEGTANGTIGGTCTACTGAREYQDAQGQTTCKTADDGYIPNNDRKGQTQCQAGTYQNGDTCTACSGNKVSTAAGATSCATTCTGNTVPNTASEGVSANSSCVACSGNEVPNGDHTACVACGDNSVPNTQGQSVNGTTYESANSTCVACSGNEVPNGEHTACVACGDNSSPNTTEDKDANGEPYAYSNMLCLCEAGYGYTEDESGYSCTACATGEVKTDKGNTACGSCTAANTVPNDAVGGVIAGTSCVCTPGYYYSEGVGCTACAEGSYKSDKGNATACTSCATSSGLVVKNADNQATSSAGIQCVCADEIPLINATLTPELVSKNDATLPHDTYTDLGTYGPYTCNYKILAKVARGNDLDFIQAHTGGIPSQTRTLNENTFSEVATVSANYPVTLTYANQKQNAEAGMSYSGLEVKLIKTDCPANYVFVGGECNACADGEYVKNGVCTSCPFPTDETFASKPLTQDGTFVTNLSESENTLTMTLGTTSNSVSANEQYTYFTFTPPAGCFYTLSTPNYFVADDELYLSSRGKIAEYSVNGDNAHQYHSDWKYSMLGVNLNPYTLSIKNTSANSPYGGQGSLTITRSRVPNCPYNATCKEEGKEWNYETDFVCNAGYTLDSYGLGCAPCPSGTYKDSAGNGACSD